MYTSGRERQIRAFNQLLYQEEMYVEARLASDALLLSIESGYADFSNRRGLQLLAAQEFRIRLLAG